MSYERRMRIPSYGDIRRKLEKFYVSFWVASWHHNLDQHTTHVPMDAWPCVVRFDKASRQYWDDVGEVTDPEMNLWSEHARMIVFVLTPERNSHCLQGEMRAARE